MIPSDPVDDDEQRLTRLMVAYQNGDLGAFEQLYAVLSPHLTRYFRNADRDRCIVSDLVQETFLEMHRARRTYTTPLPVRPWAFGVARNVLARRRRAAHQEARSAPLPGDDSELSLMPQTKHEPVSDVIDMERAIAQLPASTREPWLLHHLMGLSFDSIASHLGTTAMAAKLRSSRATRALRRMLAGGHEEFR